MSESDYWRWSPAGFPHTRLLRAVKKVEDPLQAPRFRHRKIPKADGRDSAPAPVMQSPPRPLTAEDLKNWKVPPCVSNWKNSKGYVIPLDKRRINADAWDQCPEISQRMAKLAEALYVAEEAARESVALRGKIQGEFEMKEKERRDKELRELAWKARDCALLYKNSKKAEILEERREERAMKRRLEAREGKNKKKSRVDGDRYISERSIALGLATTGREKGELMFDVRLVDQEKRLNSGFGTGDSDHYNVYDKRIFSAPSLVFSTLFRQSLHVMDDNVVGDEDEQLEKISGDARCRKSSEAFAGATKLKDGLREFEKEADEDFFGLDEFFSKLRR